MPSAPSESTARPAWWRGASPMRAPSYRFSAARGCARAPRRRCRPTACCAPPAVREDDRQLLDPQPGADRAVRRLDLEGEAGGRDRVEVDRAQGVRAKALEAAGEVTERAAEHGAGVRAAAARQKPPVQRHALDAAALD